MEAKPVNDVQYNHMGKNLFWVLGPDVESDKSVRYDKWGCTDKVSIYTVSLLSWSLCACESWTEVEFSLR